MLVSLKLVKTLCELRQLSPFATPLVRCASVMRCKPVTCPNQNNTIIPISFAKAVTPVNQLCLREIVRSFTNRAKCKKEVQPRCSIENLKKSKCYQRRKRQRRERDEDDGEDKVKKKKPTDFMKGSRDAAQSMWFNPECCLDSCRDILPRFDDLYYKESDKSQRRYAQTWAECPDKFVQRRLCCFDGPLEPPYKKRKPCDRPSTACPEKNILECPLKTNYKCPVIKLPKCRAARTPPKCRDARRPSKCRKKCTPYPSYSECVRKKPKKLRARECQCVAGLRPMCEVWEVWRKKVMHKLKKAV